MTEDTFMISKMNFMKVIHIKLSYKGWEPIVSEISGENGFF